ncbi:TIGR00730 family Rossman fold protein [Oscillatoria amoena NRMC-F 0135]|nr:TIGR00730 family Rossman fold protein [Oscillatoria amoena NRMC-F 0135]
MKSLCVYLGSMRNVDDVYVAAARELGRTLAERGIRLIYGAGNVGLMGELANACLEAGGEVVGVIPRSMVEREWAHLGLSKLHVVDSMHERKAMMADLADAFLAMPGGLGTLEEIAECLTWIQLGFTHKPAAFWNVNGYYNLLRDFFGKMREEGFIRPADSEIIFMDESLGELLRHLEATCAGKRSPDHLKGI